MLCCLCEKTFTTKNNYFRHLRQMHKNNPVAVNNEIEKMKKIIKFFKCDLCEKGFSTLYNLSRHTNSTCRYRNINKDTDEELEDLFEEFKSKLEKSPSHETEKLFQMIDELKSKIHINQQNTIVNQSTIIQTITNNDNRHIDNSQNINIQVLNIGEENLNMLKNSTFLNQVLDQIESNTDYYEQTDERTLKDILVETYRKVNCNPDYPENHNLYKGNKSPYTPFYIKIDNKWLQTTDLDYV